jgi:uncharacterized protein (DUF952 family)
MIYHMLPVTVWQAQLAGQPYVHISLTSEGFIHASGTKAQLLWVANRFFAKEPGEFAVLCIDEAKVRAEVRWEAADDWLFPHIYGPLNLDAVVAVVSMSRHATGEFALPAEGLVE